MSGVGEPSRSMYVCFFAHSRRKSGTIGVRLASMKSVRASGSTVMRVVAGSARGSKLLLVPGDGTRPILDRVKTALFDILRPRISGLSMLDLFAGSGSVGIEALSQGAAHCTFIDRGHKAVATIKRNLGITGLQDRAQVLHADALQYLKGTTKTFDLIYVAPPQYKNLWVEALGLVAGRLDGARRPRRRIRRSQCARNGDRADRSQGIRKPRLGAAARGEAEAIRQHAARVLRTCRRWPEQ